MKNNIFKVALLLVIVLLTYQFGVKAWFKQMDGKDEKNWAVGMLTHDSGKYDVIVVGEDPEGIAAAVSASRLGARTLLLAQGKNAGGIVEQDMLVDLETNRDENGEAVNKGIFSELSRSLGYNFSIDRYISVVNKMLKKEKNLDVVYNTEIDSVVLDNNSITGVNVSVNGKQTAYNGKRFIDATRDGTVLKMCGDPYFTGSEDINLKNSYMPARLNFEMGDVDWDKLQNLINSSDGKLALIMGKYNRLNINIDVNNLHFFNQGSNRIIVQGIEVFNLDVGDESAVKKAYIEAEKEVENLVIYLKKFPEFKDIKSYSIAKSFYFRENNHFIGEQTLGVNDILGNKDCANKIALGSYPVDAGKFTNSSKVIVGMPSKYAIPLGCIIPFKTDNLLMVGSKISYSSLAESSAGSMSVGITTGESAGVVAVYSLVKSITPRDILKQKKDERIPELEGLLKKQGVYLSDIKVENKNSLNWSYPAVKQLNNLGLLEGGINNDYSFKREARQKDVVTLLLNGIYRLAVDKYSIDLNIRLNPYVKDSKITPEIIGEMLLSLYGDSAPNGRAYSKACKLGYIDKLAQLQMNKKKYLTMEDVYNLCANNLKLFTGKDIIG